MQEVSGSIPLSSTKFRFAVGYTDCEVNRVTAAGLLR